MENQVTKTNLYKVITLKLVKVGEKQFRKDYMEHHIVCKSNSVAIEKAIEMHNSVGQANAQLESLKVFDVVIV